MLSRLNVAGLGFAIALAAAWGNLAPPLMWLAILAGGLIMGGALLFLKDPPKPPPVVRRLPTEYERERHGGSRWIPGFGISFPLPFLPFRGWLALFRWRGRR